MKVSKTTRRVVALTLGSMLFAGWPGMAAAAARDDKIVSVLRIYERALNGGDVDGVLRLYAEDGVFMPQHSPPQVGKDAVRAAYEKVFKAIDLNINFDILEIEILSDTWAFARTTSSGTTRINATGDKVPENNQELFVLKKQISGEWEIARYIFSTTNPRQ